MRPLWLRLGDWLSGGLNMLLGGDPDESTSGRSYRDGILNGKPPWRLAYRAINALFWWEDDHCRAAYLADLERARRRISISM